MAAPIAPHLAEECWEVLGHSTLAAEQSWPAFDRDLAAADVVTLPVQINGKRRAEILVERDADEDSVKEAALALESVQRALGGKKVKRIIVVPQRIINVVV